MIRKVKLEEAAVGARKIAEWAKKNYVSRVWGLPKGGAILANMIGYYGVHVEDRASRPDLLKGTLIVDDVMGRGSAINTFLSKQKSQIEKEVSRARARGVTLKRGDQEFKTACLFWFENDKFRPDFFVKKLKLGKDKVSFPYQPLGWAEQRLGG